jgi:hypothetical protein
MQINNAPTVAADQINLEIFAGIQTDNTLTTYISPLVRMKRFWNSLHQVIINYSQTIRKA